jgi:hypothetical protein
VDEPSLACVRHPMTLGEHICGECGHQFCRECVVLPFGPSRPPLCIACALELGGVRRQRTGRPKLSRRSVKERLMLQRQREQAAAPEPAEPTNPSSDVDDPAWLEGHVDPERIPGAWRATYD